MDNAILIQPKDRKDFLFIKDFLQRAKVSSTILDAEYMEDLGLLNAINKGRTKTMVDTENFMKKLRK